MFTCHRHGWVYNQGRRCPNCFRERVNSYQDYLDNNYIDNSISAHFRRSEFDAYNPTFISNYPRRMYNSRHGNNNRYNWVNITNSNTPSEQNLQRYSNSRRFDRNSYLVNRIHNLIRRRNRVNSRIIESNTSIDFINTFNQSSDKLEDISAKTSEFKINNNNIINNKCSICLHTYSLNQKVRILPCMHYYHSNCIDKWLHSSSKCPICQHDLSK